MFSLVWACSVPSPCVSLSRKPVSVFSESCSRLCIHHYNHSYGLYCSCICRYIQGYNNCAVGLSVTEETIFVKFLQFIRKVYISVISWCTFFPSRSHTFFVTTISLSVSCKSISRILKIFDFSRLILLVQKV